MPLDGIGVNAVINLSQIAANIPAQGFSFIFLEALKLLDEIELELNGNPRGKLKGDVLMGIGSAITARFGNNANRAGFFDPLLGGQGEAVESRLNSKPVEFDGFKTGVVEMFPNTQKFQGIAIS